MNLRYFPHFEENRYNDIHVSARIWKIEIKIPFELCLKKNKENVETMKWAIYQILN